MNVFLARQSDIEVAVGHDGTDFGANKVSVRVTLEANLVVKVPSWIETVTRTA